MAPLRLQDMVKALLAKAKPVFLQSPTLTPSAVLEAVVDNLLQLPAPEYTGGDGKEFEEWRGDLSSYGHGALSLTGWQNVVSLEGLASFGFLLWLMGSWLRVILLVWRYKEAGLLELMFEDQFLPALQGVIDRSKKVSTAFPIF